jgi:hypothetical protein
MIAFLAPDMDQIALIRQDMKMLLAWKSIKKDADTLNLDNAQMKETDDAISMADKSINEHIQDAWRHLIVPAQEGTDSIKLEEIKTPGVYNPVTKALQKMKQDELLIDVLSPKILFMEMSQYNLWQGKNHITVRELWACYMQYVYMHRLKNKSVLERTLEAGIRSGEFFAYAEGQDDTGRYEGLVISSDGFLQITPDGLIVEIDTARAQIELETKNVTTPIIKPDNREAASPDSLFDNGSATNFSPPVSPAVQPTHFYGSVKIDPAKIGSTAGQINTEVLQHFSQLPGVSVEVSLDIQVHIPSGVPEDVVRTIRENCHTLKFDNGEFYREETKPAIYG